MDTHAANLLLILLPSCHTKISLSKIAICTDFQELVLAAFQSQLLVCCGGCKRPLWMREGVMWLAALLLLAWPYRMLFNKVTKRVDITFIKELEVA